MGASLAWGVAQSRDADGWLIALADMAWIRPASIRGVAAAVRSAGDIAAPWHAGRRGHPVAFGRDYGVELAALQGDQGARGLLAIHASRLRLLPVDDAGVLRDLDTRPDAAARGVEFHAPNSD
jgi:molybdenum cofactor cytidylyltransferase